jgi:predicted nucleotidyltransferase
MTYRMTPHILQHLHQTARREGFQILYACETGSRGWGFASPDSDFDVRYIFVYPRERYLSVFEPPEQFTQMLEADGEELDFSGWELGKLLLLLSKSNATPYEWLQSPIVYQEVPEFREALFSLGAEYLNPRTLIHHYLGICHKSMHTGIDGDQINIKKYFYVLRPLLAAKWAADKRSVPPMQFRPLLNQLDESMPVRQLIEQLWIAKEQAKEGAYTPLLPEIQHFVAEEMARCKELADAMESNPRNSAPLDQFFRQWLID